MKKHQLTSVLVLGISALLVHEARGQIFRIDMDASTPAIDTVISPLVGSTITVGVYLDLGGVGGFPPGVSTYGVSLAFDNVELTLSPPPPAATQSIPTLVPFGFTLGPAPTELEVDLAYNPGGTWGTVGSFLGYTFAVGPVGGLHPLGTIKFTVDSISDDGLLDVCPFFNVAALVDGLYDNTGTVIATGPANFVCGSVVPEPSVGLLGGSVLLLWAAGRRFRRQRKD